MFLSVFDLFKIGIGPSSSHTMGPMVAAGRFLNEILNGDWPRPYGATVAHIKVSLHGSLAYTGVGHASDRAVILGLCGELPATVDLDNADALLEQVTRTKTVRPAGHPAYAFDPAVDLVLDKKTPLPGHANGMAFSALDRDGRQLLRIAYFSVGGGFVVDADELAAFLQHMVPQHLLGEALATLTGRTLSLLNHRQRETAANTTAVGKPLQLSQRTTAWSKCTRPKTRRITACSFTIATGSTICGMS